VPTEIVRAHTDNRFEIIDTSKERSAFTDRWSLDSSGRPWPFKLFGKGASYDVPVVVNPQVEKYIRYFQTNGKKFFAKWLNRSSAYMPMIKGILAEEGMPEDLAYLALIESGFSPHARSKASAVGVWQFMRWTGKHNGLKIDWWIDERKDTEKATHAAARHLRTLHNRFDSWYLAAAAYNAGEGKIAKAIRKHKTTDFWEIASKRRALKRETKDYIPKYLAAMIIAKEPAKYGFTNIKPEPAIAYDKVEIKRATDIKVIAKAAGVSVKEIKRLNPELLRWFTPPNYKGYEIKLPPGTSEAFTEKLAQVAPKDRLKFYSHKIKPGESLYRIARRYNTSIREIAYLNDIKRTRLVRAGKFIVVPVNERTGKKLAKRKLAPLKPLGSGEYVVISGDTLWDLSMRYDIPLSRILKMNGLNKRSVLRLGQRLTLKTSMARKAPAPAKPVGPGIHVVQAGDTLWDLSNRYNVSLNQILKWNGLKKTATLRLGQRLRVKEA
jgi:membrane-bound lytic murein transglycosylase D